MFRGTSLGISYYENKFSKIMILTNELVVLT